MNIKAVVFDLDGVLTSSSREHYLAWAELARSMGKTLSPAVYDKVKGISRMESLEIVLADTGMSGAFSDSVKAELADKKNRIYVDMISRFDESNLAPGAKELFEFLKRNDIKIALGSVSKNSRMLLVNMGISGYFDYVVDPALIKRAKPAPDIFLDAARHFSLDCSLCVGIEDAPAGITAIKSAGMFAVGIGGKALLAEADIVYERLEDVDMTLIDSLITQPGRTR